ncbi:hypothetical protein GCM10027214_07960 [Stenotrophomonas tumulicola]
MAVAQDQKPWLTSSRDTFVIEEINAITGTAEKAGGIEVSELVSMTRSANIVGVAIQLYDLLWKPVLR